VMTADHHVTRGVVALWLLNGQAGLKGSAKP